MWHKAVSQAVLRAVLFWGCNEVKLGTCQEVSFYTLN